MTPEQIIAWAVSAVGALGVGAGGVRLLRPAGVQELERRVGELAERLAASEGELAEVRGKLAEANASIAHVHDQRANERGESIREVVGATTANTAAIERLRAQISELLELQRDTIAELKRIGGRR